MKPIYLLVGCLISVPAFATIDRTVEKTFTVQPGGELSVETRGGGIEIRSTSSDQVHVVAHEHFRANSEKEADELMNHLKLMIEQTSEGVSAIAKIEQSHSGFFGFFNGPEVSVDFSISVPKQYHLKLKSSGGSIQVADIDGNVDVKTSGGSIELGKIDGQLAAETSGGNVSLKEATHRVNLSTSGGSIDAGAIGEKANLSTSGGSIRVHSAGGPVQASTSGGSVAVDFVKSFTGDSSLETSGGGIDVRVPNRTPLEIDAATSGGDVQVYDLEITTTGGKIGSSQFSGKVGAGGPKLTLRTSGGGIQVKATN